MDSLGRWRGVHLYSRTGARRIERFTPFRSGDGRDRVTTTGSNFQAGASVTFGGVAATVLSIANSTTIDATTPVHAAGPVSVAVTNPDGQSGGLNNAFTFAHVVTLSWDASPSTLIGSDAFRATQSDGPYTKLNQAVIPVTTFDDTTVQSGVTYFYIVTALGTNNAESVPSNEAVAVIPTP